MNIDRPLTAQLEITDKCNLRCLHCYHIDPDMKCFKSKDISDEKVLSLAKMLAQNQLFSVVLTGGEPLIRKNLVILLTEYFKDNNMYVSLNTNLLLLDEKALKALVKLKIDGFLISCPSHDPKTYKYMTGGGSHSRFEKNLKMVIDAGVHLSVNMVVNKTNIPFIRENAAYLKGLGVKRFGATPMGLNAENPQVNELLDVEMVKLLIGDLCWIKQNLSIEVDIFEALAKCVFPREIHQANLSFLARKCQAGRSVVSIANNGDVRPCSHNPDIYGNLFKESLVSIWEKMSNWRSNQYIPDDCKLCKAVERCIGGCRITAKAITKDNCGKDPWMTAPLSMDSFAKKVPGIKLTPSSTIFPSKEFRWRKQEGNYLVCTKNTRNITLVNNELFRFLYSLRNSNPIQLDQLAQTNNIPFTDPNLQDIIRFLAAKNLINVANERR